LYIAVKGDGVVSSILDTEELKDLLCEATRVFANSRQAFSLQRTDERFDLFINAILGFRIQVTQISGIAKLAQDKSPKHARQARDYLLACSNKPAADLIEQLLQETLPE
jgi:predicted FMN-binding regulatory protein PaiB